MSNAQEVAMAYQEKFQKEFEEQERRALRDRFAMAALTGMLADVDSHIYGSFSAEQRFTYFSKRAYEYADAMLKARGDE